MRNEATARSPWVAIVNALCLLLSKGQTKSNESKPADKGETPNAESTTEVTGGDEGGKVRPINLSICSLIHKPGTLLHMGLF